MHYTIPPGWLNAILGTVIIMKPKIAIKPRQTLKPNLVARPKRSLKTKLLLAVLSVIALGSLVLLAFPYMPRIIFWITRPSLDTKTFEQEAKQTKSGKTALKVDPAKPGNRIILPGIGADIQIIEGTSIYAIGKNQGAWRETRAVNPTMDGNMVLAGHRFIYNVRNSGVFYNLPELKVGSKIYVRWDNKMYEYEIYNTRSVLPTQTDIRDADPSVPRKLTMYTCWPLGSTAKRFVVEAKQL